MTGRIYFPGNPWPEGHPIKTLEWSGRLDAERGLIFDLHLDTHDYYSEREIEDDEDMDYPSDYEAPIVWSNYHACTLSSSAWPHPRGWLVGTPQSPLSFLALDGRINIVDDLEAPQFDIEELEDRAFHIYLLGHDDVAHHRIKLTRNGDTWNLEWRGRIALAYTGHYDFDYTFHMDASGLAFDGFKVGADLDENRARSHFAECCREAALFDLVTDGEERWFKFRS